MVPGFSRKIPNFFDPISSLDFLSDPEKHKPQKNNCDFMQLKYADFLPWINQGRFFIFNAARIFKFPRF